MQFHRKNGYVFFLHNFSFFVKTNFPLVKNSGRLVQYSVIIEHGNMQDLLKNICKYTRNKKEDKVKFVHTGRATQSVKKKTKCIRKIHARFIFLVKVK